jgi:membrane protein implicated in regulation of membrane protease activity
MPKENVVLRQILAVVGGFALWSILWLLLGQLLTASGMLSPPGQPVTASLPLLVLLVGSVAFSLLAGYAAAVIARARDQPLRVVALDGESYRISRLVGGDGPV